jgi:SNF2 family DNA or RNA helicase
MNYEWLVKPGAEAAIRQKIAGLSVQHRKRECLDLPPLVEEIREVELLDSLAGKYEQMRDEYIVWLNSQTQVVAKFATTRLIKLRQIVSGFIYGEPDQKGRETISLAGCAKIAEVEDIIEEMPDQKIIIFCHFNESVKTLADHFRPPCAFTYYGGDDTHEKENALHEFENNPRCNFLIASIASAAHGLNLQFCSNVIFYELDFNLENYLQAIQRIERIGQKNKMTVYYLLTKGTVENYIYRRLRAKKSLNDDIDINELRKSI